MLSFAIEIATSQHQAGNYFALEHPVTASSWSTPVMLRLKEREGVYVVDFGQCRYGQQFKGKPVRQPTRVLTNSKALLRMLGLRCECRTPHQQLIGGKLTSRAAKYPGGLVKAIVDGL